MSTAVHVLSDKRNNDIARRAIGLFAKADESIFANAIDSAAALIEHQLQSNFILPKAGRAVQIRCVVERYRLLKESMIVFAHVLSSYVDSKGH